MWLQMLIIGAGGFLGAMSRFLLSGYAQNFSRKQIFPYGTLVVNVLGCLLIGLVFGLIINYQLLGERTRLLVITGFLGSFTTFSSFGYETFVLIKDNEILLALINILTQVTFGLVAVWLGYILSKLTILLIGNIASKLVT